MGQPSEVISFCSETVGTAVLDLPNGSVAVLDRDVEVKAVLPARFQRRFYGKLDLAGAEMVDGDGRADREMAGLEEQLRDFEGGHLGDAHQVRRGRHCRHAGDDRVLLGHRVARGVVGADAVARRTWGIRHDAHAVTCAAAAAASYARDCRSAPDRTCTGIAAGCRSPYNGGKSAAAPVRRATPCGC
jgi:hypothetical protein